MIKRLFFFLIVLAAFGGAAAYYLVPWNSVLEKRITAFLQTRGLQNIAFNIDSVGLHSATFKNIAIGEENPLLLQSITVQYNPKELIDGNIKDLTLSGLDVQILETDDGWKIAGLEDLRSQSADSGDTFSLNELIDMLPFSSVNITDSQLRISGKTISTALPFNMKLTKLPEPSVAMTINATNLAAVNSDLALGIIKIDAHADVQKNWNGTWSLESLDAGKAMDIPIISGGGSLSFVEDALNLSGDLASADRAYSGSFKALYDLKVVDKNTLTISAVRFPFKEGVISSRNIVIPLKDRKSITLQMNIQKVSMDALLQTLTGKRVTATGTVSGTVPVILKPDGSYSLGKGNLKADSEGLIQMSADAIPGDNEQVALVREVLENLHYSVFSAGVETTGGKGMVVRLSLEGSNPDVYDGRLIKLNVNLTGDILDFIQQNAMLFTNPEKLLEQKTP